MPDFGRYSESLWAWVRFTGATAAILANRGVTSVTRTGAGDYQIVLDVALDANESTIVPLAEAVAVEWAYVHTSDTSKQILALNNAGAATDPTTVSVKFYQNSYGTGL